jgi:hypothetical protein
LLLPELVAECGLLGQDAVMQVIAVFCNGWHPWFVSVGCDDDVHWTVHWVTPSWPVLMNNTVTSCLPTVEVCHFGTRHFPGSASVLTKKAACKDTLDS